MFQAKKFYVEQLKDGPLAHRKIMNRMVNRFDESSAMVRDALVAEGVIEAVSFRKIGKTRKRDYLYKITGKPLRLPTDKEFWDDGVQKSKNNAFDWRGISSFTRQEIANASNKGRPSNYNPYPITTFSRA